MSQTGSPTRTRATVIATLGRLGRFILFLCTAGWAYPHVCTEEMDLTRMQKENATRNT